MLQVRKFEKDNSSSNQADKEPVQPKSTGVTQNKKTVDAQSKKDENLLEKQSEKSSKAQKHSTAHSNNVTPIKIRAIKSKSTKKQVRNALQTLDIADLRLVRTLVILTRLILTDQSASHRCSAAASTQFGPRLGEGSVQASYLWVVLNILD